jgi:hypothetical protein
MPVLIEVNSGREPMKSGVLPEGVPAQRPLDGPDDDGAGPRRPRGFPPLLCHHPQGI